MKSAKLRELDPPERSFELMYFMIVISILGILALVAIPALQGYLRGRHVEHEDRGDRARPP